MVLALSFFCVLWVRKEIALLVSTVSLKTTHLPGSTELPEITGRPKTYTPQMSAFTWARVSASPSVSFTPLVFVPISKEEQEEMPNAARTQTARQASFFIMVENPCF